MKRTVQAFAAYCLLTLALTFPLIMNLGSVLPNDAGDPALNTWILWWNTQAAPYTARWWNAPVFYPAAGVLTFSENLLGLSLIATPLYWLGAGPQAAYNVVFLLTFPLSGLGAYLLARELTGRRDAAFVAGLLFGFAPYRIAHLPQIQALASFPMPFALLGLHRYLRDPRPRWLALFAAGWLLQGLCNGYYLLFFTVFVGLWTLWFASPWSRPKTFVAIAVAWFVAALPILPLLLHYRHVHAAFGFTRDAGIIQAFSADLAALLHGARALRLWGHLDVFQRAEGELFPGLTITLLLAAGAVFLRDPHPAGGGRWLLVRRVLAAFAIVTAAVSLGAVVMGPWRFEPFGIRVLSVSNPIKPLTLSVALGIGLVLTSARVRAAYLTGSAMGFYVLAAFLTWFLSLGPVPTVMGSPLMYRGPYALLMVLPGFSTLRVPARFWMTTILCLAMIGAMVFDRLAGRFGRMRAIAAAVIAAGIVADTWMSAMPLARLPEPLHVAGCSPDSTGALLELPVGDPYHDVAAMYRQMSHRRPLVNGYSGYFPPHYAALRFAVALRDRDVLTQLAALGVTDVVVHRDEDSGGRWSKFVAAHPTAQLVCTDHQQSLYRLSASAPESRTPSNETAGNAVPVAVIRASVNGANVGLMMDRDRTTRWESGPQRSRTYVELDLGGVRTVTGVELALGPFVEDFPRGLVIEASEDGQTWRQLWRGTSAGLAFVGAFEAPLDVPLRYHFEPASARLLRMHLTANDDTYYWSIAELKVQGP